MRFISNGKNLGFFNPENFFRKHFSDNLLESCSEPHRSNLEADRLNSFGNRLTPVGLRHLAANR